MNFCFQMVAFLMLTPLCSFSMEDSKNIIYSKAESLDISSITDLIDTQAINDNKKIVIVPENFRQIAVAQDISNKKIFIAKNKDTETLVAFKKLFIISNKNDFDAMTHDEIRCCGPNKKLIDAHIIDHCLSKKSISEKELLNFSYDKSIVIYLGSDFTAPEYRNRRINSHLTDYAFSSLSSKIKTAIQANNIDHLILLYGLTKENSGEYAGTIDRSPSLLKAFMRFIKNNSIQEKETTGLHHYRYEAFMPTFNPKDTECKPLPDDQAIEGYGNIVIYPLTQHLP